MVNKLSLSKYYAFFAFFYIGLKIFRILEIIPKFANVHLAFLKMLAPVMVAGLITTACFIRNFKRAPHKQEQKYLVWGSIIAVFFIEFIFITPKITTETDNIFRKTSGETIFLVYLLFLFTSYYVLQFSYSVADPLRYIKQLKMPEFVSAFKTLTIWLCFIFFFLMGLKVWASSITEDFLNLMIAYVILALFYFPPIQPIFTRIGEKSPDFFIRLFITTVVFLIGMMTSDGYKKVAAQADLDKKLQKESITE